jgi:hypothetical protein
MVITNSISEPREALAPEPETIARPSSYSDPQLHEDNSDDTVFEFEYAESPELETESNRLKMLESYSQASLISRGKIS